MTEPSMYQHSHCREVWTPGAPILSRDSPQKWKGTSLSWYLASPEHLSPGLVISQGIAS